MAIESQRNFKPNPMLLQVRNLVSFVRKRDRRVQAYRRVLEERAEANRQKQQDKRKEQLRERQAQLAAAQANKVVNDGYEEQLRQLEQQYGSESDEYTDEDEVDDEDDVDEDDDCELVDEDDDEVLSEVEYVDELYCVACNKSFKNAKARANHEESKKHRENVERLRQQMEAEEEEFNEQHESLNATEESLAELQLNDSQETDPELASDENVDELPSRRNKKNKKAKKTAPKAMVESEDELAEQPRDPFNAAPSNSDDDDADDWSRGGNKKSAKKSKSKKAASGKQKPETEPKPKPASSPEPAKSVSAALNAEEATTSLHTCVTCKLSFDSKNKLFAHLKKTNHGVYIPKSKPEVEGKPPGKGKAKGRK